MKTTKVLSVILILLIALSMIAGCSEIPAASTAAPATSAPAESSASPEASVAPESSSATPANTVIRLSTTTSVNDSGLLPYLQDEFTKDTGYTLEITSNGTGAAIKLGENGDADCLLVHAKASEEEFINAGYGLKRIPFMYNYFVICGAKADAAKVADCTTASDAFKAIAAAKAQFISRGDDSGTHKAELKIWDAAGIDPSGNDWYLSVGKGMGDCLTQASELGAYLLTDKGTYLSMKDKLDLEILLEKSDEMKNTYSVIAVNPEKHEGINAEGAQAFIDWITSDKALVMIAEYGKEEYGESLFYIPEDEAK